MRLFLSSYRFGDYGDVLLEMLGDEPVVGIITNAKDDKTLEERAKSVQELIASFQELGVRPHEIDLRPFFGQVDFLRAELGKYSAVWVAGGNTFVLRRALKASGGDVLLRELVGADVLLYGGESAGAVVATPTLQGAEFGDDPDIVPEGYTDEDLWDGLGLVPYCIVPHYESGWEGDERMIEVLEEDNIPYKTLNDHQVIVVDGDETERL